MKRRDLFKCITVAPFISAIPTKANTEYKIVSVSPNPQMYEITGIDEQGEKIKENILVDEKPTVTNFIKILKIKQI